MPAKLVLDVSCTQKSTVIEKVLITPFAGPARLFPAFPYIQNCYEIALAYRKSATGKVVWLYNVSNSPSLQPK